MYPHDNQTAGAVKCILCGNEANPWFYNNGEGPCCLNCYLSHRQIPEYQYQPSNPWYWPYQPWEYNPDTNSYEQTISLETVVEKLDIIIKLLEKEHGKVETD